MRVATCRNNQPGFTKHPSYRCHLQRSHQIAETGVLDFIQLRAKDAEQAARQALAVSGAIAVTSVERLEPAIEVAA